MNYKVIEEHKMDNDNPIKVKKGEKVRVGRESNEDDGWCNWIYCYSLNNNSEGWTPAQILQLNDEYGTILQDYWAKELDVIKGDTLKGETKLNGWVWVCKIDNSEWGWVPEDKIVQV